MAYHDTNCEGLTFSEWVQAAGLYRPRPGYSYCSGAECAGYSSSTSYYQGYDRHGNEADLDINLYTNGGRSVRKSQTTTHFPRRIREAWRNGEDPSDHLPGAPRRWSNPPAPAAAGE
jgi:hypothetical protein